MGDPKQILKGASYAFMIFGGIAVLYSLVTLFSWYGSLIAGYLILAIIEGALSAGIGFLGLQKSNDSSQFNFFIMTGGILCALGLVGLIMGGAQITSLVGFVLPGLYLYGGFQLKNGK